MRWRKTISRGKEKLLHGVLAKEASAGEASFVSRPFADQLLWPTAPATQCLRTGPKELSSGVSGIAPVLSR